MLTSGGVGGRKVKAFLSADRKTAWRLHTWIGHREGKAVEMEVQRNPSSVGLTRKCGRREADPEGLSDISTLLVCCCFQLNQHLSVSFPPEWCDFKISTSFEMKHALFQRNLNPDHSPAEFYIFSPHCSQHTWSPSRSNYESLNKLDQVCLEQGEPETVVWSGF